MNHRRFPKAAARLSISTRLLVILLLILGSGQTGRVNPAHVRAAEGLPAAPLAPMVAADAYWSVETVDPGSGMGRFASIVIDSADHLHVSYQDTSNSALCYATFDGSTWVTATVDNSGNVGRHTSIGLDDDEYPHVSHSESESGLRHAYWNGTTWVNEAVDYSADVGEYSSLGVGSTYDDVYIGYYDASSQSLKAARYMASTGWLSGTVDAGPGVGRYTSLAMARYPQVVYYDITNDQLKYAEMDMTGFWDFSESPVNAAGDGGMYASLALDSNDDPRVSYFDSTNNELVYAHHTGTSWTNRMIDTVGSSAVQTAIAVDGNDYAHIAYYDDVGGSLRYAAFNGSAWVTETIESGGVLGYPAIDIDSNGYPHIAYQTTVGLKHAWLHPSPDLVVTDIWYDTSNQLRYQVHNVGLGSAPAGHEVSLSIDGVGSGTDTIPTTLAPKERYSGSLTTWSCSGISDTVRILVDRTDVITETDETNNSREETWLCDPLPPTITWGPTPTSVLTDSAVIRWGTDEVSDSRVTYDRVAEQYGSSEYAAADVTAHQIILTGLTPGSAYQYIVESTDPSGNTVTGKPLVFETSPLPSEALTGTLSIARVSDDYDIYSVAAVISSTASLDQAGDAAMNDIVTPDHLEFYVNDQFIGASYSGTETGDGQTQYSIDFHPHNVGITLTAWGEVTQTFKAYLVHSDRTVGKQLTGEFAPVSGGYTAEVVVTAPANNAVYYTDEGGKLPPGATIAFTIGAIQYEWRCDLINGGDFIDLAPGCETVSEEVDAVEFYIDDQLVHTSTSPIVPNLHSFSYDAEGMSVGTHTLRGVAITSDGQRHDSNVHTISVEHGTPSLDVQRTVTHHGNFYEVELTISLDAGASGPAFVYALKDYATEMMPVQQETPLYTLSSKYPSGDTVGNRTAQITIDFGTATDDWIYLSPGDSREVVYQVVPILYEQGPANPALGDSDRFLWINYFQSGETIERRFDLPWSGTYVADAVGASDYILVTNPDRLLSLYCDDEVHDLLSSMAHLAVLRNGVLGFLDNYYGSAEILRYLTSSGGYWAEALHPDFLKLEKGYMMIVGETEVVPAWTNYNFDICWNIPGETLHCSTRDNDVYHHDQWYSSRSATSLKPHLVVGRIIGNTAAQLEQPILTSIGVYEGQSGYEYQVAGRALVASGFGKSVQEKSWFDGHGYLVGCTLDNNNGVADWDVEVLTLTQTAPDVPLHNSIASGISLLHLMGHGSADGWGGGALSTCSPPNFNGHSPFVFVPSCLTGNYETGDDYNLAESLFDQGIAVYIGSTQVSPVKKNMQMGLWFYKHDWSTSSEEAIGRAFIQLEKDFYDEWDYYDWYKFWIAEYNYYGDPKFGASDPTPLDAAGVAMAPLTPTTSLNIQVPTYVVTPTVDGFDHVEIPDGRMILEEGLHEVPYWITSIDYAPGYRVQGVDLTLRSGQVLTTGLNLPVASMTHSALVAPSADGFTQTLTLTEDDEWFVPLDQVYEWHVTQNPDGSSTLTIQVFPFHYQPATTNVEWYDTFDFEIDVISNTVAVDHFSLDKATYAPGDMVQAEMWLSNGGDAQDLIMVPTIRNLVTNEVIDGEELDTLYDVSGAYSYYSFEWDSSGFEPGQYVLWVDVLDADGNLLYTTGEMFQLGSISAEVTAFDASHDFFQPGDDIDLSLTVSNTGHLPLDGEVIIMVQPSGVATATATFTHTVTGLAPGAGLTFEPTWDTSGIDRGDYRILGYVKYESKATEIETIEVSSLRYVYLPLVVAGGP
jgi:hypothetical protein